MEDDDWSSLLSILGNSSQAEPEEEVSEPTDDFRGYGFEEAPEEDNEDEPMDESLFTRSTIFDGLDEEDIKTVNNIKQMLATSTSSADVTYTGSYSTNPLTNVSMSGISDMIADKESKHVANPYEARALDKNGKEVSSATGKYQFIWSQHHGWIEKVTGVGSREEFMKSPAAQEQAFSHWDKVELSPKAEKYYPMVVKEVPGVTLDQVKMMLHFGGEGNMQKALKEKNFNRKLDAFGSSLLSYIK